LAIVSLALPERMSLANLHPLSPSISLSPGTDGLAPVLEIKLQVKLEIIVA